MADLTDALAAAKLAQADCPQRTDAEKQAANARAREVLRAALGIDEKEAAFRARLERVGAAVPQRRRSR